MSPSTTSSPKGGSVGVFLGELSRRCSYGFSANGINTVLHCGDSILNYGGGGTAGTIVKSGFNTE